jgi:HK97 gp10 family phage protein
MAWRSKLPLIAAEIPVKLDATAAAGAEMIAAAAQDRVPVRTGALRDAIHVERTGVAEYEVIAGNAQVFYGHIVEHGGAYTPARPFMTPALEASKPEILKAARIALRSLK